MADPRHKYILTLVKSGDFKTLTDIFTLVPITVVSRDMGMHNETFARRVNDPLLFTIEEIERLAGVLGVDKEMVEGLIGIK